MVSPALAIFAPTKNMSRRMRALAMCPQMIPGMAPSGTITEQSSDATASLESRSGVVCRRAAAGAAGAGRDVGGRTGGAGGGLLRVAAPTGAGLAAGADGAAGTDMVFRQAGHAI